MKLLKIISQIFSQKLSLPALLTPWMRLGVVLGFTLAYAIIFLFSYRTVGNAGVAFAVLPVTLSAGLYGLRGGLVSSLLIFPLNLLLVSLSGVENWADVMQEGGLVGSLAAVLTGIAVGLLTDMTGRIQAEDVRARLTAILEATTDLVATAQPDGRVLYINQAGRRMLGLGENENLSHLQVGDFQTPQTRDWFLSTAIPTALREGVWKGETVFLNRSRAEIPVSQLILAHMTPNGKLSYLSTIARDITEIKRAEQAERQHRKLAEALRDTASALNSTLDFDEILERILINAEQVVPHDMASIGLIEGDLLRITRYRKSSSNRTSELTLPLRLSISKTPNLQHALKTKQPTVFSDTRTDPNWVSYPESGWVRSYLRAPICVHGEVIGFLNLASSTPGFYQPQHAGRLQAFADQAGIALHNARLLEEAERRAGEFAVLYEMAGDLATKPNLSPLLVTLIERATALLDVPGGEIFLYDPEQGELELAVIQGLPIQPGTRLQKGEGLAGRVAASRQPLIKNDYRNWEHRPALPGVDLVTAALGVPMLYRGELIGVLVVFEKGVEHHFIDPQARLLSLFAGQAASAVHNARLFEETRRRLAEMEAINRISTILRSASTVDEMLPAFLDEILAALNLQAGAIWLLDPQKGILNKAVARDWIEHTNHNVVNPGEGIAGTVFQTGQFLAAAEFTTNPETCELDHNFIPSGWGGACIPIHTNQTTVGVLLACVQLPRQLTRNEIHLLLTLADMAGNAINRANLHEQTQKHLRRLAALHTVDMTINASLDMNMVFGILLDQALLQLQVDAARILTLNPHTQSLDYKEGRGFLTHNFTASQRLDHSLSSQVVVERRLKLVPDLSDHEQYSDPLLPSVPPPPVSSFSIPNHLETNPKSSISNLKSEGFVSYCGVPLIAKGQVKGVLEIFHRAPLNPDPDWLDFVETLAGQAAIAIENASLFTDLQRSNLELTLAYDATIEGWSRALDLRDRETEGHTLRVTEITLRIARAMGVSEAELVHIRRGALLHDIGKMAIPDSILLKPKKLNTDEWEIMRMHPGYAYGLLSAIPFLRPALDIPYAHHEKWDGSGYPRGLKGEQIPLSARIFAVADVWDALCSNRPYRDGWTEEKARRYLRDQAGKHFDPHVVEVFLKQY